MKADGTIWIDTKIDESGMEDGFNRMRDGADDVAVSFRNAGKVIEKSFSNISFNKTIENLKAQIRSLEEEFASVSREFEDAIKFDDDKAAEKLGAKRTRIYDRIARAREKLAVEVAAAAQKEAAAEEKASKRVVAAEEKEAAKKRKLNAELKNAGNSASYFGNRLRGIVTSAFVFNVISAGLRKVTSYFGSALMANNQFATAVGRLRGSLMVAFQPIYESVLPALITLINWLNVGVQAVARFFSVLAGKSYKQMQSNAVNLNNSMNGLGDSIEDVGEKAKKAERCLAGFDEINKMLIEDADLAADKIGSAGSSFNSPVFDEVELPSEWSTAIDKLAMRFKDIFFEWENLTPENIAEKLVTALAAIAGGLIGFAIGGPAGAVIGMTIGAGLGVVLSSIAFDGDGQLSEDELIHALIIALGAIVGGVIGFAAGGLPGAAIGIVLGAGITFKLSGMTIENDGVLTYEEVEKGLLSIILPLGGAGIGVAIGGAAGGIIGFTIGSFLSFVLTKADITAAEGTVSVNDLLNDLVEILRTFAITGISFYVGGSIGGPLGGAIGIVVGLALSFLLSNVSFKPVEKEYDNLDKKTEIWSRNMTKTTESEFIQPTSQNMKSLQNQIGINMESSKDSILRNMEAAEKGTDSTFFKPVSRLSNELFVNMLKDNKTTADKIVENMVTAEKQTESGFIIPTKEKFAEASKDITENFGDARENVQQNWIGMPNWFQTNVTEPIIDFFNTLTSSVVGGFNKTAQSVSNAIDDLMDAFSRILSYVNGKVSSFSARASSRTSKSSVSTASVLAPAAYPTYPVMDVPMLARGAVIPPNHKFLAVLGDQRSGTNVEAPLATIQEAVAVVMEDMIQSNLAGHEATVALLQQILEAVLGIELDGETISRAMNNYNAKMAAAKGGLA